MDLHYMATASTPGRGEYSKVHLEVQLMEHVPNKRLAKQTRRSRSTVNFSTAHLFTYKGEHSTDTRGWLSTV